MAAIYFAREYGAPVRMRARLPYYGGKSRVCEAKRARMYSRNILGISQVERSRMWKVTVLNDLVTV
jgi:hypothetical protein